MDDFDIVNFPFHVGDVPRRPSCGVYLLKAKSNFTKFLYIPFPGVYE